MTRLLEWLLDLENIHLGSDAPLLFKWEGAVQAWVLFCFGIVALAVVAFAYIRERTTPARRIALAVVRCACVALVVAVLCQPSLVLQRNRVETSHAALVLDASQSMAAKEHYADEATAASVARGADVDGPASLPEYSRWELIQAALIRNDAAAIRILLRHNAVELCTFSNHVETRGFAESPATLSTVVDAIQGTEPDGMSTDLAGAIHQVIEKSQGRRLAAIVLATDGQTTQPTSLKDALDLAAGRQIPIYPLRIGSTLRPRDIEIGPVRAQETVFVNDILVVEAEVRAAGLTEETPVKLQVVDERTGSIAATQSVTLDPTTAATTVELRTKPTQTGLVRYRVEAAALAGEQRAENNADHVDVTILDDRLRVLYVDGYPRFEYRYLKNALLREQTMTLSVLLIEADEQFVQEGSEPIRRFPDTPEELGRYDIVLFGDVDPRGGWLSQGQMNMLLDFVGNEGGGFGLIAGERAAPHRFLGTPLEKLVPVVIDPQFSGRYEDVLSTGFQPRLTVEGRRSRVFRFAADREASENLFDALPELYWIARTLGPKPGASVLAEHPTLRTISGPMPLVVTGRYGAGKLFFQATDDTWRWRRHTGELLYDGYWIQVARELMRGSRVAKDRRYVLRTDRRVYGYGAPIQAQVEVFDPQLLNEHRDSIRIGVTERSAAPRPASAILDRFEVHRVGAESNLFEGTYVPPHPGGFLLETEDIALRPGDRAASVFVHVERPDLEARRPEADHEVLERIAAASGGHVLDLDELEVEFGAIRDRSVRIPDDVTEPLWDSKLVLMIFVLMISVEWGLRKAFGLM